MEPLAPEYTAEAGQASKKAAAAQPAEWRQRFYTVRSGSLHVEKIALQTAVLPNDAIF